MKAFNRLCGVEICLTCFWNKIFLFKKMDTTAIGKDKPTQITTAKRIERLEEAVVNRIAAGEVTLF